MGNDGQLENSIKLNIQGGLTACKQKQTETNEVSKKSKFSIHLLKIMPFKDDY